MTRGSTLVVGAVLILTLQAIASHAVRREPFLPSPPPLANLPLQMGNWSQLAEETIDPEALAMLGPDDSIVRIYKAPGDAEQAELFVAYYKTQLRTKTRTIPKFVYPERDGTRSNPAWRWFRCRALLLPFQLTTIESKRAITSRWSSIGFRLQRESIHLNSNSEHIGFWMLSSTIARTWLWCVSPCPWARRAYRPRIPVPCNWRGSPILKMLPYFPPTEKAGS